MGEDSQRQTGMPLLSARAGGDHPVGDGAALPRLKQVIDATNAEHYLRETGWLAVGQRVIVQELAGGVSNLVLWVSFLDDDSADFVLKQAREQLRTAAPWFCTPERIWREVEVLHACQRVLEYSGASPSAGQDDLSVATPRVLFEDRENYLFAMTAAPRDHRVWKTELLAGRAEPWVVALCGQLLGALHAGSWHDQQVAERLADRSIFTQLRIDPYYRSTARAQPEYASHFERLIDSVSKHALCLVHADFSPKNILVHRAGLLLVDFETGHYGDPAFDLGFFLSHLALKAFHHAPRHQPYLALTEQFWQAYGGTLQPAIPPAEYAALIARAIQHFAACAWARLDGTSRIDYLADPARREQVRSLCRTVLDGNYGTWQAVLNAIHRLLDRVT
jgi:5-methylthioribose kinase